MLVLVEDDEMGQRDRFVVLPFLGIGKCIYLPTIGKWLSFHGKQMSFACTVDRPSFIIWLK
jgi:hypothetical protein